MKSFSQFGSDLDASTVAILNHGEALLQVLKQGQYEPYPLEKEIFYLYMAKNKYLDSLNKNKIGDFLKAAYAYMESNFNDVLVDIKTKKEISVENENKLKEAIEKTMERCYPNKSFK